MWKTTNNTHFEGGTEEIDKYLSIIIKTENDLQQQVGSFSGVQSVCWRTIQNTTARKKKNNKSVPWWTDSLTLMRKRVNACRRLYQRTKDDEKLRESRKRKYNEAKGKYQAGIKKENLNSWKEYCNVTAATKPRSQVYKLASGKIRANSIMTTLTKPDGSQTKSKQETMEVMLDYLFKEDSEEENSHQNKTKEYN